MNTVKQNIKTLTFQIANRMGIDSKHSKIRNFAVKFKTFPKNKNHIQAKAYLIPYVSNEVYAKYPSKDYPSKDIAWFDVGVDYNIKFVRENKDKINTPAIYNLIVHELSHIKHGIENYRSFFHSEGHDAKIFKNFVKKYARGTDIIKQEWTTGTSPSTDVPQQYYLIPHNIEYVMMLCPRCGYVDTGQYEKGKPNPCDFCGFKNPIKVIFPPKIFTDYVYQVKRIRSKKNYHEKVVDLILKYMTVHATQSKKKMLEKYINDKNFMNKRVYNRNMDGLKINRKRNKNTK